MWDRVKSNWVKHIPPDLTYNSSLASTFCFYPQHLHHATDLPLFNWMLEGWLSPAIPCSSFPKHEDGNQHWTKPSRTPKIAVQTEMLKLLKAVKSQPFILLLLPVIHGPTCWLNPTMAPLQSIFFPHLHGFQSKSRQIKMPHQTNSPALVLPLAESFQLTKV